MSEKEPSILDYDTVTLLDEENALRYSGEFCTNIDSEDGKCGSSLVFSDAEMVSPI